MYMRQIIRVLLFCFLAAELRTAQGKGTVSLCPHDKDMSSIAERRRWGFMEVLTNGLNELTNYARKVVCAAGCFLNRWYRDHIARITGLIHKKCYYRIWGKICYCVGVVC